MIFSKELATEKSETRSLELMFGSKTKQRYLTHNNKEFQIAIKKTELMTKKNTHTHHTQLTTKDCPSVKTDCDAKGQTGGLVTFVTIALSPLRSVTRGHERTNSAREVADSAARALY